MNKRNDAIKIYNTLEFQNINKLLWNFIVWKSIKSIFLFYIFSPGQYF